MWFGLFTVLVTDENLGLKLALRQVLEVCTVAQISKPGLLNTSNVVLVQVVFDQPMAVTFDLGTPHIHRKHSDVRPFRGALSSVEP